MNLSILQQLLMVLCNGSTGRGLGDLQKPVRVYV
jgi:hypothetical protein